MNLISQTDRVSGLLQPLTLGDILRLVAEQPGLLELFRRSVEPIEVFCTTLRDGGQTRGVTWTEADKLVLADYLVDAGFRHIEVGWPVPGDKVNPSVLRKLLANDVHRKKGVRFYAFSGTERADVGIVTAESPMVACLLETGADYFVIFGKSWTLHLERILRISREENLRIIHETIAALVGQGKQVIYDAEHAGSGWLNDPEYFFQTLQAAVDGGAKRIVLCDTKGMLTIPSWLKLLLEVVPWVHERGVEWGIHTHNDTNLAVALAQLAVEVGCTHIQGTAGGIGERAGNCDITALVVNLQLLHGFRLFDPEDLTKFTGLVRRVFAMAGIEMPYNQPHFGMAAKHHEAGTHTDAFLKDPASVEHIPAELIGSQSTLGLSNQAGRAVLQHELSRSGIRLDKGDPRLRKILSHLHSLESEGYLFETARGSFQLVAWNELGQFTPWFTVMLCRLAEDIKPFDGMPNGCGKTTEDDERFIRSAMVLVQLPDGRQISPKIALGDGLVNAFDSALRLALQERGGVKREPIYPQLKGLTLINYHVKALVDDDGTAAKVRVIVFWRSENAPDDIWGTVAVSTSVTEASAIAVAAGYQYFLEQTFKGVRRELEIEFEEGVRAPSLP